MVESKPNPESMPTSPQSKDDGFGFVDPPAPAPTVCRCGAVIQPVYMKPYFSQDAEVIFGGKWYSDPLCKSCQESDEKFNSDWGTALSVDRLLLSAGLGVRERGMAYSSWDGPISSKDALQGWLEGKHGLYLHGPTGTGKTHAAVGLIREFIIRKLRRAYWYKVPNMLAELRKAVKDGRDSDVIADIVKTPALCLDDLACERQTDYAHESLYLIIDGWYSTGKTHLIITSNLNLDDISSRLDDRIASRIAGSCKIVELSGKDRRIGQVK